MDSLTDENELELHYRVVQELKFQEACQAMEEASDRAGAERDLDDYAFERLHLANKPRLSKEGIYFPRWFINEILGLILGFAILVISGLLWPSRGSEHF